MPKWIIWGIDDQSENVDQTGKNIMYRKCYMEYYLDMKEKLEQA